MQRTAQDDIRAVCACGNQLRAAALSGRGDGAAAEAPPAGERKGPRPVKNKRLPRQATPEALAELSRLAGEANTAADQKDAAAMANAKANLLAAGKLLGLLTQSPKDWEQGSDEDGNARIDALVQARVDARANKDWAEADRIRNELAAEGIEIMDGAGGSNWRRV